MIYIKLESYKGTATGNKEWTGSLGTDIHNRFICRLLVKLVLWQQRIAKKRELKEKEESKKSFKEFKTYLKDSENITKEMLSTDKGNICNYDETYVID